MKKSIANKMMFYSNPGHQMNEGMVRLNGWSQVVPMCMPWASNPTTPNTSPDVSSNTNAIINEDMLKRDLTPNVMQFTANYPNINSAINSGLNPTASVCPDPCTSQTATRWELLHNISMGRHSSHQHLKRRNDSSDEELEDGIRRPVKQYISEEKVSAIFNRLQINNNNEMLETNDDIECEDIDETDEKSNPIVFTQELQNAIKTKTMTEKLFQNELEKHSKALVLWQPNHPFLSIGLISGSNAEEEAEENDTKTTGNEYSVSDIDTIDLSPEEEEFNELDNDLDSDVEMC